MYYARQAKGTNIRILAECILITFTFSICACDNNQRLPEEGGGDVRFDSITYGNIISAYFKNDGLSISFPDYVATLTSDSVHLQDFLDNEKTIVLVI